MFFRFNKFTILWASIVLLLTLVSGVKNSNMEFSWIDKGIHVALFSILCFLIVIGFTKQNTFSYLRFNAEKASIFICISYGLLIEIIQFLLPYRTFSWLDVLANSFGAFGGIGLFYLIYKFRVK